MENMRVTQGEFQPTIDFSDYQQHERLTHQQVKNYQDRALQACRTYAYAHSPFYQRFHQGLMNHPLQDLPILTKAMVMEHFDELVTDRDVHLRDIQRYMAQGDTTKLFLDRYRMTVTSGTTGQPAVFISNRLEGITVAQTLTRVLTWVGVTPENRVAAVTSPIPVHITAQFPQPVLDGKKVPYLQLASTLSLEALVERLNEWQPDVLLTYASFVSILANEQRQGNLHIPLHIICCTGETLTDEMRRRIEETWHTKMFNIYAASEGGVLAGECSSHQGLHLFEDFSLVEIADKNNHPVSPGEAGEKLLLTVLSRRTQPLIRYEMGDLMQLTNPEPCSCGRPFARVKTVTGRVGEVLYFSSLAGHEKGIAAIQIETVFDPLPLSRWQIVQEDHGLQILLLGASEELHDEQVERPLRELLIKQGMIVPPMKVQRVTALSHSTSGKTPMLISRITRNQF